MKKKKCEVCGKDFEIIRESAKVCSKKCSNFKHREKNREKYNQISNLYNKEWRKKNPEKWKEMKKKANSLWKKRHPEKWKVQNHGYEKRGDCCSLCGSIKKLEFHHSDYNKNEGITLCMDCHKNLHKLIKGGKKYG